MSSGRFSQIRSIIASTASGTRTSQPTVSISPLVSLASSSAVSFSTSSRRPQITTLAPSSRKRCAIERPSPVPPPVTRMRLPFSRSGWNIAGLLADLREGDPRGDHLFDLVHRVAELAQHCLGVGAEGARLAAWLSRRARELHRVADVAPAVLLPHHLAVLGMWML